MALTPSSYSKPGPKFPTPISEEKKINKNMLPNDLVANGRNFYMQLGFQQYSFNFGDFGKGNNAQIGGVGSDIINLPIPQKINDNLVLTWSETDSGRQLGGALIAAATARNPILSGVINKAVGGLSLASGILTGQTLNPYLVMYFQRPNFREFTFQWTLTLRTKSESDTLKKIVDTLRNKASPTLTSYSMGYPDILLAKIFPNDVFGMLKFKPMAITNVSVDHTAAGPAFIENGSPVIVNLGIHVKEIGLWSKGEFG